MKGNKIMAKASLCDLHGELAGVGARHGAGLTAGKDPNCPDVGVHHAKGAAQGYPTLD